MYFTQKGNPVKIREKKSKNDRAYLYICVRFLPECKRNPLAYMAFGVGPRICIGMRFALIEIKIAVVKILQMFEVAACSRTAEKLDFIEGIVRSPKQDIIVQLKRR